jgi:polyhydroxyalkanoate synthesis regulator protein
VPTYLDFSIDSLVRDQDKLRGQMANAFGPGAFGPAAMGAVTDQVRRNTEMFEQAMRMFLPFANGGSRPEAAPSSPSSSSSSPRSEAPSASAPKAEASDMEALRRQLDEMQKRLDRIAEK